MGADPEFVRAFRAAQADGEGFHRGDLAAAIQLTLDSLPVQQARAVELVLLEGKTQREAAAELGITQPAVARLIRRASQRFARFMCWLQDNRSRILPMLKADRRSG